MRTILASAVAGTVALAAAAGCGGDDGSSAADGGAHIVVTTNVLGDVVGELVGPDATVEVVMPPGRDPHDFAPSAKQAAAMRDADVLVVNGWGLEAGLVDTIEAAEADGVTVLTATDAVEGHALASATDDDHDHADGGDHAEDGDADDHEGHDHSEDAHDPGEDADGDDDGATTASAADDHDAEDHGHGGEEGHEGHSHGPEDPHFFTDPVLMGDVVRHLADELVEHVPALDAPAFQERVDAYVGELDALDDEVSTAVGELPEARRKLVTNHDVFGYFAERYGFTVVGVLIPGGSTLAEPSAAGLHELSEAIAAAGVPAVFAETSSPSRLADALAAEGTDVEVVELFTESLGPPDSGADTYLGMVRTNVERIVDALAG